LQRKDAAYSYLHSPFAVGPAVIRYAVRQRPATHEHAAGAKSPRFWKMQAISRGLRLCMANS